MASFDLTANINARLNQGNVRIVANQLRQQLSVTASVNVQLAGNTSRAVTRLSASLRNLNRQLQSITQNSTTANRALATLGNTFQNINGQLAGLQRNQQNLQNLGNDAARAGTQMEQFGRQAGLAFRRFAGFRIASGLVQSFTNALTNGVKESISFERELIRISQVSNRSITSLSSLVGEVTRLSTSLGVSSSELIGISRILSQAGLSSNETRLSLEALAKSSLAPTFTDINNTAEGAIAIFKQFGIQAEQLQTALGGINAVSGQFAVESDDIIAAVKRAGGVFAATSEGVSSGVDALNEFVAVFTSVRATTREGAETIATGLRTIFTRVQRPTTIAFLQELGVNLTDLSGKFVGPFEAINRISEALRGLDNRDPQFARLVEELGGFRQVGKVIPLLTEQETRLKALKVAQEGFNSLNKDSETAQQALAVQLARVREEFLALIRSFTDTNSFKAITETILQLSSNFITLAESIKPILPLLTAFAVFKGGSAIAQFSRGLFSRGGARFHNGGYVQRQGFNSGGMIGGGRGVRDDVPATLQAGEFVIRRRAVDAIGRQNLESINRQGFAAGGSVPLAGQTSVGAALLKPLDTNSTSSIVVTQDKVPSLDTKSKSFVLKRQALSKNDSQEVSKQIELGAIGGIRKGAQSLGLKSLSTSNAKNIFNTANPEGVLGSMFEGVLLAINNRGIFDSSDNPNRPFDFTGGFNNELSSKFPGLQGLRYIDAKFSERAATVPNFTKKIINQLNLEANAGLSKRRPITKTSIKEAENKFKKRKKANTRLGLGFLGPGFADGGLSPGDVPAMLTRGEFVINRRTASALGTDTLNRLNNADRLKFASGGGVGRIRKRRNFIGGGEVLKRLRDLIVGSDSAAGIVSSRRISRSGRAPTNPNLSSTFSTVAAGGAFLGGSQLQQSNNNIVSSLGGGVTGAVTGATIGASIGSVIPGLGTVAGAVGGGLLFGVLGALNTFNQSKLDDKVAASTDSITQSLNELQLGLKKFKDTGDISQVQSSLQNVGRITSEIRALEVDKVGIENIDFAKLGASIASQQSKSAEAAQSIFESQIKSGASISQAIRNLGPGGLEAIAFAGGSKDERASLALNTNAGRRSREAERIAVKLLETTGRQIQQQEAMREALENSVIVLDKFNDNLLQISSEVTRAGSAGNIFAGRNAAILGGSVGLTTDNPFRNFRAFSGRELGRAAANSVVGLGGSPTSGIGGDIVRSVIGLRDAQNRLPDVIAQAINRSEDEHSQFINISKAISDQFGILPKSILDTITGTIKNATQNSKQSISPRQFAQDFAGKFLDEQITIVTESLKKYIDVLNKATNDYDKSLNQWIGLQDRANSRFDSTLQRQISGRNNITSQDRSLTFNELTAGTNIQRQIGFQRAGGTGPVNAQSVLGLLSNLDSQRQNVQTQIERQRSIPGGDPAITQSLLEQQAQLISQRNNAEQILKDIADNTNITASATTKLRESEDRKKSAQQLAEEAVTANPRERRQIRRDAQFAQQLRSGTELTGSRAEGGLRGIRREGALRGLAGQTVERQIRELLARRSDVGQQFSNVGRNAFNALVESPEDRRLRALQLQGLREQRDAGIGLGNRRQGEADRFAQNARDQFQAVVQSLSEIIRDAGNAFSKLPSQITVGGEVQVAVNITGGETFASIENFVGNVIDQKLEDAFSRYISQDKRLEDLANA